MKFSPIKPIVAPAKSEYILKTNMGIIVQTFNEASVAIGVAQSYNTDPSRPDVILVRRLTTEELVLNSEEINQEDPNIEFIERKVFG